MNKYELDKILQICLPPRPYNLRAAILKDSFKEFSWEDFCDSDSDSSSDSTPVYEPETLLLKSARVFIDQRLKDQKIKERVIDYFSRGPAANLNCEFLRSRLDLFMTIFENKLNTEEFPVDLKLFKNHLELCLESHLVLKLELENYATEVPFKILRTAFLRKVKRITFTMNAEEEQMPSEEMKWRMETFLNTFETRQEQRKARNAKDISYQRGDLFFLGHFYQVIFFGISDTTHRLPNWGDVL